MLGSESQQDRAQERGAISWYHVAPDDAHRSPSIRTNQIAIRCDTEMASIHIHTYIHAVERQTDWFPGLVSRLTVAATRFFPLTFSNR